LTPERYRGGGIMAGIGARDSVPRVEAITFGATADYVLAADIIASRQDGRVVQYGPPRIARLRGPLWWARLTNGACVAHCGNQSHDPHSLDTIVVFYPGGITSAYVDQMPAGIHVSTPASRLVHGKPLADYTDADRMNVYSFYAACPPDTFDTLQDAVLGACADVDDPAFQLMHTLLSNIDPPPPVTRHVRITYAFEPTGP
jgi:hypothetical protein